MVNFKFQFSGLFAADGGLGSPTGRGKGATAPGPER